MAEIFEKVSFDPYNFRITRLSCRKSEQMPLINMFEDNRISWLSTGEKRILLFPLRLSHQGHIYISKAAPLAFKTCRPLVAIFSIWPSLFSAPSSSLRSLCSISKVPILMFQTCRLRLTNVINNSLCHVASMLVNFASSLILSMSTLPFQKSAPNYSL